MYVHPPATPFPEYGSPPCCRTTRSAILGQSSTAIAVSLTHEARREEACPEGTPWGTAPAREGGTPSPMEGVTPGASNLPCAGFYLPTYMAICRGRLTELSEKAAPVPSTAHL